MNLLEKSQKMKNLETEGFKPAPAEYFTGKAFVRTLVAADSVTNRKT